MGSFFEGVDAGSPGDRVGDSAAVVRRIVAAAHGRCACCHGEVDVQTEDEARRLIHTVSAADVAEARDWPALVCDTCRTAMGEDGITSVVDFVFSRRPACPACGAKRAVEICYGEPSYEWITNNPPWETSGGCCIDPGSPTWSCATCGHQWEPLSNRAPS